jgi:hypothetical protein
MILVDKATIDTAIATYDSGPQRLWDIALWMMVFRQGKCLVVTPPTRESGNEQVPHRAGRDQPGRP